MSSSKELYLAWYDAERARQHDDSSAAYAAMERAWDAMVDAIQDHSRDCRCLACQTYRRAYEESAGEEKQ